MARPKKSVIQESGVAAEEPTYVLTTPGWEIASGLAKKQSVSPTARRGRGRPPKSSLAVERSPRGSSDFESPRSQPRNPKRSRLQEAVQASESEEAEYEDDESEEEVEEDVEEGEQEEEEESELSPTKKAPPVRRQAAAAPLRMNIATKVQRLRADPNFSSIRPETLSRVVEQFEHDPNTPSVIINTSVSKPVARRKAVRWTEAEVENLRKGVAMYGTSWHKILADPNLKFGGVRTQVDLKDKYRNLHQSRMYSELPIRRFVLVNENHEPILTDRGHYHIFNNRWPADAATKVATKDFVYGEGQESARIYLREIPAEGREGAPEVHVFDVSRRMEALADVSANIPRFRGSRGAYVGEARKVCTERLISRQAVLADLGETGRI